MSKTVKLLLAGLVLVVVLVGVGVWWFLRDDSPEEANAEDAGAAAAALDAADSADEVDDINGTWSVEPGTGADPNVDDPEGTYVGFRIEEELSGIGSTTAVGRTGEVTGEAVIEGDALQAATFEVDVTSITTNDRRRDDQVQRALGTSTNPTATFTLTEPVELDPAALDGSVQAVTATGELTIAGTTKPVEFPLEAQLVGSVIAVNGAIDVTFSDYGVQVPDAQIVLSVDDHGTLELQLLLTKAA